MGAFIVVNRGMFSRNVTLDEAGIRRGRSLLAWDDVDHYRYDWHDWSRPGDFLVAGRRSMLRIAPIFDQWDVAADRIMRELHPRLAADPFFYPFKLEGDELVHNGAGRLALADIIHIEIAPIGSSVTIVIQARDRGEWLQIDISDIANPWLWLDQLAQRGIAIVTPLPLYLPPVLTKLSDWSAIDRSLPMARVVRRPRS